MLALLALATTLLPACSGDGGDYAPPLSSNSDRTHRENLASEESASLTCSSGDLRSCNYYLPEHNGVHSCILGQQRCTDGVWGPCLDVVDETPPDAGSVF